MHDKLIKHYANQRTRQLRELLRRDYGARRYRITSDGDIDVYGTMPNTNTVGWYCLGTRRSVANDYQL
jgi:hypothetical protein